MTISSLWNNVVVFWDSILGKITFAAIVIAIGLISMVIKNKKVKSMMKDGRFNDSKLFDSKIETPIVISKDGYIGIINDFSSKYSVINLKNINGMKIVFDDHDIISTKKDNTNTMLFQDIVAKINLKLQERVKNIYIIFELEDGNNSIMKILLYHYVSRRGSASVISDELQVEIKQLLEEFENTEKRIKSN